MFRIVALCMLLISLPGAASAATFRIEFLGASTAALANPHDIKLAPDGKRLFVSDVDNDRVAILDADTLALLGHFGADHQDGTHDVDFDRDGRLYVADTHNGRVTIYEMSGTRGRLVGELSARIRGPEGVLVHPNGRIYVGAAWSGNLVVYENGKVVQEMQGLSSPHDVELTPSGDIWLADAGNNRMLLLTPDLNIRRELSGAPYNFRGPRYQDVMPDGTLIVADKNTHSVKIVGPDGALLQVIGTGRAGKGPGQFTTPEGVELRGDTLWISDSGNDRIVKYRITRQ
jgi:DNA-binding beta-propeller fold protein YncE